MVLCDKILRIKRHKGVAALEITFYRNLANKVADAVVANQEYSEADVKRIRYGLVCIFSDLYKFLLLLIIFTIFSLTIEFIIAFLGILLLRPFVAGFHAKSELACIFVSFFTMLISIIVGDMNIFPPYLQIISIVLLPVIGIIISPVRVNKIQESNTVILKLFAGITTLVLLMLDFHLFPSQVMLVSVFQIYILAFYQLIKNIKTKKL